MVTIQTGGMDDNIRVVCVFEYDEYPRGGRNVGIDSLTQAAINADFNYKKIYDRHYPEYGTTIGVVKIQKRSVMMPRLEDFREVASMIRGYVNTWIVSDDPTEHPEIYKQVQTLDRL